MQELMKQLNILFNSLGYQIFFNEKPKNIDYPFVIWNLPNVTDQELREDYTLEVDIWTKDASECISMTSAIDRAIDRKKVLTDDIQFSIYKINQLNMIADEDDTIKRNQLRYNVKTYYIN
jgi:hypothetical protein